MRKAQYLVTGLLLLLFLAACAPGTSPAAGVQPLAAPAKPAWQAEWDRAVAAAKAEGKVTFFTYGGADQRTALVKIGALEGITAEVTTRSTPEVLAKIFTERRAGLYVVDGMVSGHMPALLDQGKQPEGILEPLDPFLIPADLTDPEQIKKVWYEGRFPWVDKNHTVFLMCLQPGIPLVVNTDLVKEGEIKSYRDLLDPKWKGKVVMHDPTIAGTGQQGLQVMMMAMGDDFVRQLAGTKPTVLQDLRLMLDWLSHGKVSIAVSSIMTSVDEFLKVGAPVKVVIPKEGNWLSPAASAVWLFKNAPHPNAAKVYVNLLASKEGGEIWALAGRLQSLRLDVPTTHLRPEEMRQERVKYYQAWTEEAMSTDRPKAEKLAKELFGSQSTK